MSKLAAWAKMVVVVAARCVRSTVVVAGVVVASVVVVAALWRARSVVPISIDVVSLCIPITVGYRTSLVKNIRTVVAVVPDSYPQTASSKRPESTGKDCLALAKHMVVVSDPTMLVPHTKQKDQNNTKAKQRKVVRTELHVVVIEVGGVARASSISTGGTRC